MKVAAALLAGALLLPAAVPAADWVRVETPHLIVFGPGEKKTREVTAEFERFREALTQILPGGTVASAVPTTVVVFDNDHAFNAYRPRYNGKVVRVSGFYTGTETDNLITFHYGDREDALRTIFHEYTHLITGNASRALPVWVSEGLAEFYSTFEIHANGKEAILGRTIPAHYRLLAKSQLLPLDQLLGVDRLSSMYNEGERRGIFYAQSWAMVHMFMTGEPNRSQELGRYVQLTGAGTSPLVAWKQAFGAFDVQEELRRYLSQFATRAFVYKFPDKVTPVRPEVTTPSAADVEAVLARLLRYGNGGDVEPRLRKAAAMTPRSDLAKALLGFTLMRDDKDDDGAALLEEASSARDDWLVQYYVASGLVRRGAGSAALDPKQRAIAGRAADLVLAARPQLAAAHALKAILVRGAEGVTAVARARTLAPGREDYIYLDAQLRAELRDFPAARTALAPLLGPNFPPEVREAARSLMAQIVRLEEFDARRRGGGVAAPIAPPDTGTPSSLVKWVFREVGPGEQRVEGWLQRIECARNGAVLLTLRVGNDVQRFAAPNLADVDFIVYREQAAMTIGCGDRKPAEHVYVTWRPLEKPTSGVIGRPVAVEFLPAK